MEKTVETPIPTFVEIEGTRFEKDQLGVIASRKSEKEFKEWATANYWNEDWYKDDQERNVNELWEESQKHVPKEVEEAKPEADKKQPAAEAKKEETPKADAKSEAPKATTK